MDTVWKMYGHKLLQIWGLRWRQIYNIIIMSVNKFILISSIQVWRNFTELSNDNLEDLDRPSESDKNVYKTFHNKGLQNF